MARQLGLPGVVVRFRQIPTAPLTFAYCESGEAAVNLGPMPEADLYTLSKERVAAKLWEET